MPRRKRHMKNARRFIGGITSVIQDNRNRKKRNQKKDTLIIILFSWNSNDTGSRLITSSIQTIQSHSKNSPWYQDIRLWTEGRPHVYRRSIRPTEDKLYATPQGKLGRGTINRPSCSQSVPAICLSVVGQV